MDRAQGLPGVRPPLPARLVRPGQPLAALDAAQRDDLRRPRHPRRLEHQPRLARGDGGHRLVARAGGRRARLLLGAPAPRQPQRAGPRRGPAVAADRGVRRRRGARRHRRAGPARGRRRPAPGDRSGGASRATSTPRRGWSSSTPGPRACSTPSGARCSTTASWPGSTSRMQGDVDHLLIGTSLPVLLAPFLHHLEAFGEAMAQKRFGRLLGPAGEWLRTTADLEHWAAFQDGFVDDGRPRPSRSPPAPAAGRRGRSRSCPATCTTATSRRRGPTPPPGCR